MSPTEALYFCQVLLPDEVHPAAQNALSYILFGEWDHSIITSLQVNSANLEFVTCMVKLIGA